ITKTGRFAIGMPSPRFLADGYAESFVRVDVVLSAKIDPIEKSVSIVSRHKSGDEKTCSISIDSEGLNPTIIGVESARGVDFYILPTDQGQMIIENGKINAQLIEVTYSTIARYDSEHPAADGRTKQFEAGDLSGMQILSREVRLPVE
ncbi:MAG: hypothetical protein ABH983_05810, partial [Candidatus Micrarchaeota archaeon]